MFKRKALILYAHISSSLAIPLAIHGQGTLPIEHGGSSYTNLITDGSNNGTARGSILKPSLFSVPLVASTPINLSSNGQPTISPRRVAVIDGTEIWGCPIASSAWTTAPRYGVYSFDATNDLNIDSVALFSNCIPTGGGVYQDGLFKFLTYVSGTSSDYVVYNEYDTKTWRSTANNGKVIYDFSLLANDMTADPTTGRVYGIFFTNNFKTQVFGYTDFTTFKRTDIATISNDNNNMCAIAADDKGTIYVITQSSQLQKVDKTTGKMTPVGFLGVPVNNYFQSMTYDAHSGKLYWSRVSDNEHALYQIDPATGHASKVGEFPNSEQMICLYIPETGTNNAVPAKVTDMSVTTDAVGLNPVVSFTLPQKDYGGNAITGSLNYTIASEGKTLASGSGTAGEKISKSVETARGDITFEVTISNASGSSPVAKRTSWIGNDTPLAPDSVKLSVNENTGKASLAWSAVKKGIHGKSLGNNVSYEITRYGEKQSVATTTDTAFTEALPEKRVSLRGYSVRAIANGLKGASTESNKVSFGSAFPLPYQENFYTSDDADLYTVIDGNEDGNKWTYFSSVKGFALIDYSVEDQDDWLITPALHFDGEQSYKLSFFTSTNSYATTNIEVSVGRGDNPTAYTKVLPSTIYSGADTTTTVDLNIPTAGDYHVAFHLLGSGSYYNVYLNDISITANGDLSMPAPVSGLKVTPGEKGARTATVSFTAPSTTAKGAALTSIDNIVVTRNGNVVSTINNPARGSTQSVVDNNPENGNNKYVVTATANGKKSNAVVGSAFVGTDVPQAPQNLVARRTSGNSIKLSWNAVGNEGVNGGYVDNSQLKYALFVPNQNGQLTLLKRNLPSSQTSFTTTIPAFSGVQIFSYHIVAYNSDTLSSATTSNLIVTGNAATAPYRESFTKGGIDNNWYRLGDGTQFTLNKLNASDDKLGMVFWYPNTSKESASINSGKISLEGLSSPKLVLSYYVADKTVGDNERIKIEATHDDYVTKTTLADFSVGDAPHNGWNRKEISLDQLKDQEFILLSINVSSKTVTGSQRGLLCFDDIRIMDDNSTDLQLEAEGQTSVVAGDSSTVKAHVYNGGSNTASSYQVALYDADNNIVSSKTVTEALEPYSYRIVSMHFPTNITQAGTTLYVKGKVLIDNDGDEANNTSTLSLAVNKPAKPVVNDLKLTQSDNGNELTWTAPKASSKLVTENFENMKAWDIYNFNGWKTVDGDEGNAYTVNDLYIPNAGTQYAWMVFNPDSVDLSSNYTSMFEAHSGKQYLTAFSVSPASTPLGHNDDWLISPALSGNKQNISFYVKMLTANYDVEKFEILYSTTDRDTASFIPIDTIGMIATNWFRISETLQEGARYFAIRYLSKGCMGLLLDDVSYREGTPVIKGYNIYCDGRKIGTVSDGTTTYTDQPEAGSHEYKITVVYVDGESDFSNVVSTTASGIASLSTDGKDVEDGNTYNLAGQRVADSYRGFVIKNGKKFIKK